MACNGNNHPPDCTCNFSGGNRQPGKRFRLKLWSIDTVRHLSNGKNAICPVCKKPVFYHSFGHGRGNYFDGMAGRKHAYTNHTPTYSPYNKNGKTKLRSWPTELEEAGWLPFFVKHFVDLASGATINGCVLDDPTEINLGTGENIQFGHGMPVMYRSISTTEAELKWLSSFLEDFVDHSFLKECPTEIELRIKMKLLEEQRRKS